MYMYLQFLVCFVSSGKGSLHLALLDMELISLCGQLSFHLLQFTLQERTLALQFLRIQNIISANGLWAESWS